MEFVKNKTLEKIKYDLVRDGLVTYEELEKAEESALVQNVNFAQVLIKSNIITEETLLQFLETKLHIPYVDLNNYSLDKNCLKYVNFNDAQKYKVIPLFKIDKVLTIAMADPLDLFAIDKIVDESGFSIEPVLSAETHVLQKIDEYYKTDNTVGEIFLNDSEPKYDWKEVLTKETLTNEHIHNLIRAIFKQAVKDNVHELFFEHVPNGLQVNFKKDSDIINTGEIPSILVASFLLKLKNLADLDANVSEIPQLGKLSFKVDDIVYTASISAFPTIQGERILIKIYKPPVPIEKIISNQNDFNKLNDLLVHSGIVLVCGSALSGKTHVIYSLLLSDIFKDKNIMTVESIAKYNLPGITQSELNENIGFNLDKAMRFIEFQSPEVIYFEGLTTKQGVDYFSSLVLKDKTVITEFLADNIDDLRKKLSYIDFSIFKSLISCIVFIHGADSIEIFNKEDLQKYL